MRKTGRERERDGKRWKENEKKKKSYVAVEGKKATHACPRAGGVRVARLVLRRQMFIVINLW